VKHASLFKHSTTSGCGVFFFAWQKQNDEIIIDEKNSLILIYLNKLHIMNLYIMN